MKKIFRIIFVFALFCMCGQVADASTSLEIDFTINQDINMIGSVENRDIDIEALNVSNNSDLYDIEITGISAEGVNGWEIIDESSDFDSIAPNSKKLSITTNNGKDLADSEEIEIYLPSKETIEVGFKGKMCRTFPSKEKVQIANIIVEIRPVLDAETVLYEDGTFIINELTYKRDENMNKHGAVIKTYVPLDEENTYVSPDSSSMLWKAEASYIKKVEIGSYIRPISTAYWFFNCFNLEQFNSENLDMSQCTSTYMMFFCAGKNVTTSFILNGLDDWDVSSVTNFAGMFNQAGYGATEWYIGDLSNWKVGNAENLSNMFYRAGFNADVWDIGNLDNWDVSKVKYFIGTFETCGNYAENWNVGDLSGWVTDSALDMTSMFSSAGFYATEWSIGDLSKWNVSKVTSFENMFKNAGRVTKEIDLGRLNWDLTTATTVEDMFYNFGYTSDSVSIGTITISNSQVADEAFRGIKNLAATIRIMDYVSNNNKILQGTATGAKGNVNLVPLSEEATSWATEMIGLYGPNGTKTKGNIWI